MKDLGKQGGVLHAAGTAFVVKVTALPARARLLHHCEGGALCVLSEDLTDHADTVLVDFYECRFAEADEPNGVAKQGSHPGTISIANAVRYLGPAEPNDQGELDLTEQQWDELKLLSAPALEECDPVVAEHDQGAGDLDDEEEEELVVSGKRVRKETAKHKAFRERASRENTGEGDNPNNPNNPNNPDNPNNANNPKDPKASNNPNNPNNPSDLNNLDNTDNPAKPDNPNKPNDPNDHSDPNNPDNPDIPDNPNDPNNPNSLPYHPLLVTLIILRR
jgi:hypothetical protein